MLVYLTAALMRNGESWPELLARSEPSLLASNFSLGADETTSTVNLENVKEIFYNDCSDEDVARAKKLRFLRGQTLESKQSSCRGAHGQVQASAARFSLTRCDAVWDWRMAALPGELGSI